MKWKAFNLANVSLKYNFEKVKMFHLGLEGKVAIITGGSDGLGRATAERFALEGAHVVICGRREDYVKEVANNLNQKLSHASKEQQVGSVHGVAADVTIAEDCKRLVEKTCDLLGGIDVLVNNAGVSAAFGLEALDEEMWQADFDLKVMAAVRLSKLVIPIMKSRGGGAILNASIGGAKAPNAGSLPTSVMRSAGLNLTKSLSNEFAADGIRVNAICIGLIKSMQWIRRSEDGNPEAIYLNFAERIPMGRVGEAEEYADLAAFLCSQRASYITGTSVNLDGGLCPVL
jgi:3-oxoacyl-[acyl-carrier protein] reductase